VFELNLGEHRLRRFVNPLYDVNSFWVTLNKSNKAIDLLIDCGSEDLNDLIPKDVSFDAVFLTHGHHDHILGLQKFLQYRKNTPVIGTIQALECLASPKLNLSYYIGDEVKVFARNTIHLNDLERLKTMEIIEAVGFLNTPGHNNGSVSYFIGPFMFTGDSWIPEKRTITCLPYGDKKAAKKSEELLRLMHKDYPIICPGHGSIFHQCDLVNEILD